MPTQLLIQGQWWSKRSTHLLQIAQCLERGVLITLQSGHKSAGLIFESRSMKEKLSFSGYKNPGSFQEADINDHTTFAPIKLVEQA